MSLVSALQPFERNPRSFRPLCRPPAGPGPVPGRCLALCEREASRDRAGHPSQGTLAPFPGARGRPRRAGAGAGERPGCCNPVSREPARHSPAGALVQFCSFSVPPDLVIERDVVPGGGDRGWRLGGLPDSTNGLILIPAGAGPLASGTLAGDMHVWLSSLAGLSLTGRLWDRI